MSRLSLERAEFVAWMMKLDPKLTVEEAIKTGNRMGERTR